ncbi:helix-turn-helix domain-containing protein [Streptacidiphilus monticola]
MRTGERDERLEHVVAKTVAGFLNADGGTLLIGVDDAGTVVGVEYDYRLLRQPDRDRYELWLHDLLGGYLGRSALSRLRIGFARLDGHDVCRIDVQPAPGPVFLHAPKGQRTADFHVRLGNSTRLLLTDEALDYIRGHWSRRPLVRLLGRRYAALAAHRPAGED